MRQQPTKIEAVSHSGSTAVGASSAARLVHRQRSARGRGFSFTELMFAVMILGIGFIMVAAVFPVALQQSKLSTEESTAAAIGRSAVDALSTMADRTTFPVTDLYAPAGHIAAPKTDNIPANSSRSHPGTVVSLRDDRFDPAYANYIWNRLRGNAILPGERYAWVALYRRGRQYVNPTAAAAATDSAAVTRVDDGYMQVFIVAVEVQGPRDRFDPLLTGPDMGNLGDDPVYINLVPTRLSATLTHDAGGGTITFGGDTGRLEFGAYVIVSDDYASGAANGRVYRLGTRLDGAGTQWELMPGQAMQNATEDLTNVDVLVVGRTLAGDGSAAGSAQEIGLYTTFIGLR